MIWTRVLLALACWVLLLPLLATSAQDAPRTGEPAAQTVAHGVMAMPADTMVWQSELQRAVVSPRAEAMPQPGGFVLADTGSLAITDAAGKPLQRLAPGEATWIDPGDIRAIISLEGRSAGYLRISLIPASFVPDEPGAVCVVMFPDDVFKYTSSIRKHLPELFPVETGAAAPPAPAADDVIEPAETVKRVRGGAVLLDVRTPEEFVGGHIAEAVNVPLQALQAGVTAGLPADKRAAIVTICGIGKRSLAASQILKGLGYPDAKSSRGGMQAWVSEGQPMRIG